jgi:hypothetical protein
MSLAALGLLALLPSLSHSQIACFNYGSMLSCDGPSGNTTIAPLSRSQGIISGDRYGESYLEPYTIMPPSSRDNYSSRDSFSSTPIEPLQDLDRLDRLDRRERDPFDSFLPLPGGW